MSEKLASASYNIYLSPGTRDIWGPQDIDKLEVLDLKQYREIIKQCRFYYRRDPIASTVLNKLVEIGITQIELEKGTISDNEFRIYNAVLDKVQAFAEDCALEFLITGLVVPETKLTTVDKKVLMEYGIKKKTALSLPTEMWIRDPATIKINSTLVLNKPSYYVEIPEELIQFIQNGGIYPDGTKDPALYEELRTSYPEFFTMIKNGAKEVLLENEYITRRRVLSDSQYPLPYLYPALEALKHKRNLRRMDYSLAARVITAIQQIKMGSDEFPLLEGEEEQIDNIKAQMTYRNTMGKDVERVFQLFTNHTVNIEWIFPDMTALLDDKKYTDVNRDIFLALGFPKILTTGEVERSSTSNSEYAMLSPMRTMENLQKQIIPIVQGIFEDISESNGFKTSPVAKFSKINLYSFTDFVNALKELYQTGNISRETFAGTFGYNFKEEARQRKDENDMLEEMGLGEFAPKPFSPQPNVPGQSPNQNPKPEPNQPNNQQK